MDDLFFLDFQWIFITFLGFIILFHLCIPYSEKRSWIKVDYLWLSLLIFPLLGATTHLQKTYLSAAKVTRAEEDFFENFQKLKNEYYSIIDTLKMSNTKDTSSLNWYKKNERKLQDFRDEIYVYVTKPVQTRQNVYTDETRDWKYENLFLPQENIKFHERIVERYITLRNSKEKTVDLTFEYQEKEWLNEFHFIISWIYPYFLTIALALRLTKVTEILWGEFLRNEFKNGTWKTIKKFMKFTYKKIRKLFLIIFYAESVRPKD